MYSIVLYSILYDTICIVLYCIVLYCIVLYANNNICDNYLELCFFINPCIIESLIIIDIPYDVQINGLFFKIFYMMTFSLTCILLKEPLCCLYFFHPYPKVMCSIGGFDIEKLL